VKFLLIMFFSLMILTACNNQTDELKVEIENLQEIITSLEDEIEELNARQVEDMVLDEDMEAIRDDFMENAGDVISQIMGLEINFDNPNNVDFGLFDQGYVWALGRWEDNEFYPGASWQGVQVLFRYFRPDDGIIWEVESFTFGGRVGTSTEARRYHRNYRDYLDDEYVPVRFYYGWRIEANGTFLRYAEVNVSGANFVEEMINLTYDHLGSHVLDMQIVDNRGINRLYVNFHPRGIPTEGAISPDTHWYERLILTFTSIAEVDEIVMLMGGVRNGIFGGQGGLWFDDVYRENDPWILDLRSR